MVKNKWFEQAVAVMRFFETGIIVTVVGYLGYVAGRAHEHRIFEFEKMCLKVKKK